MIARLERMFLICVYMAAGVAASFGVALFFGVWGWGILR